MIILGIETSCDETAVSLIEAQPSSSGVQKIRVLAHTLISQIKLHEPYGGVLPTLAKREHSKNLVPLLHKILVEAKLGEVATAKTNDKIDRAGIEAVLARENELLPLFMSLVDTQVATEKRPAIDAIAVTEGPGLEPALWVGVSFANALSLLWGVPVIPTNHMEGHIVASLLHADSHSQLAELQQPALPALALLISGGHTELVLMEKMGTYKIVGKTRDDAVGEAFDKVARLLGLPYPGGPQINALAEKWRSEHATPAKPTYPLPRPMIHSGDLDFSFSGLKTAVLYLLKDLREKGVAGVDIDESLKAEIACEFENAVTETLSKKTAKAIEEYSIQSLIIGGGVIANGTIRKAFETIAANFDIPLYLPSQTLSTDNAVMIAVAGSTHAHEMKKAPIVKGNLSF